VITSYMIEDAIDGSVHVLADREESVILKDISELVAYRISDAENSRDEALENYANLEQELEAAKECLKTVDFALRENTPEKELTADLIELLDEFKRDWML
jgi:hypothetical protein